MTDGVLRATGRLGFGAMVNLSAYYCVGESYPSLYKSIRSIIAGLNRDTTGFISSVLA